MLATSKNVLFPGHNHLLTSGTGLPDTLIIVPVPATVKSHQYQWLAAGYGLEIGHFLEVTSMVVAWWIGAFLGSVWVHHVH